MRKQLSLVFFLLLVSLILYAIVLTTSRMGLGMATIIIVVSVLTLQKKRNWSSMIITVSLLVAIFFSLSYIIDNTVVGERLIGTTSQVEESKLLQTGTILDEFGDRGLQYYDSWPFFLANPVFGIGFHKWSEINPTGHVCHSEYLVQYLECGVVGISLYLLFFIGMIVSLSKQRYPNEDDEKTRKVLLATLLSLIFGNAVLWNYNSLGVFTIYGLVYAVVLQSKRNTVITIKK